MDTSHIPSFACELSIIRARNIDPSLKGTIFVRLFLQSGEKFWLSSREIPAGSDPQWNETMFLECGGNGGTTAAAELRQKVMVFELRRRKPTTIFRRIKGSELMGRVEIPWKHVLESPGLYLEDWFPVWKKNSAVTDLKPSAIRVRLEISISKPAEETRRQRVENQRDFNSRNWDKCGCRDGGCNCREEEVYGLSAASGNF